MHKGDKKKFDFVTIILVEKYLSLIRVTQNISEEDINRLRVKAYYHLSKLTDEVYSFIK